MATAIMEALTLPFIHPDDMPDQYALTSVGQCMVPLIADGTLVVFDKRNEPRPGDLVGLVLTREAARRWGVPGLLKRLALALPPLNITGDAKGLIVVDQINPPRRYCVPAEDVLAVHKAIGTAEHDGPGQARFCPSEVWS